MVNLLKLPERLLREIEPEPNSGCWLWAGRINGRGYGQIRLPSREFVAHRLIYDMYIGVDPKLDLHHKCGTKCCVNAAHLEPVTRWEHASHHEQSGETHCSHGHELAVTGVYWCKAKARSGEPILRPRCKVCDLVRKRAITRAGVLSRPASPRG